LSRLDAFPQLRLQVHRLDAALVGHEQHGCICFCPDLPSAVQVRKRLEGRSLLIFCPETMKMMCSLVQDQRTHVLSLTCSESQLRMALGIFLSDSVESEEVDECPITLTKREQQVLTLMVSGQDTRQIASALHIKMSTVIAHKKHLFLKSGVHSSNQLIVWALFSLYR
ncbi:MAG: LuxR C-terminal-related transcriptional regulator, partial [Sphaerochaetaceae bacterium]